MRQRPHLKLDDASLSAFRYDLEASKTEAETTSKTEAETTSKTG